MTDTKHTQRPHLIKPGTFGLTVAADSRRGIFDAHNESLLAQNIAVDTVFIGDSITDMWAVDAYFRGTHGQLVNRGIGADRTPFVRRRFAADVVQLHPRLVIIMIGVNNFWDLDTWWDASLLRTPQAIEAEIVDDITTMVKDALTNDIIVGLCSILPTNIPFNGNTAVRNEGIIRVNERTKHLAHELQNVTFIDYHRHFVANDGLTLRAGLADDGLHPHAPAYAIMTNVLLATLQEANISVLQAR